MLVIIYKQSTEVNIEFTIPPALTLPAKKVNQKDDYDAIADEILRLRDQRRQAEVDSVIKDEQMKQIRELQDFVKKQPSTITEFDEALVSRLIEKITVFEDHFTVDFKSGVTIDIEE